MSRKGIFVGSFDPFTIGHADIVSRALPLFDTIVIGVGMNESKLYMQSAKERSRRIKEAYKDERRNEVQTYGDLTVDFAHRVGANFIIKGVRSIKDFEYEREQAVINRRIGDVDTLLLYADPRYDSISSSMIRELLHFGKEVDEFLP